VPANNAETFTDIARKQIVSSRLKLARGAGNRAEEVRLQQLIKAIEAVIKMRACALEVELELYAELESQLYDPSELDRPPEIKPMT
jgi:hypothetical protein